LTDKQISDRFSLSLQIKTLVVRLSLKKEKYREFEQRDECKERHVALYHPTDSWVWIELSFASQNNPLHPQAKVYKDSLEGLVLLKASPSSLASATSNSIPSMHIPNQMSQ